MGCCLSTTSSHTGSSIHVLGTGVSPAPRSTAIGDEQRSLRLENLRHLDAVVAAATESKLFHTQRVFLHTYPHCATGEAIVNFLIERPALLHPARSVRMYSSQSQERSHSVRSELDDPSFNASDNTWVTKQAIELCERLFHAHLLKPLEAFDAFHADDRLYHLCVGRCEHAIKVPIAHKYVRQLRDVVAKGVADDTNQLAPGPGGAQDVHTEVMITSARGNTVRNSSSTVRGSASTVRASTSTIRGSTSTHLSVLSHGSRGSAGSRRSDSDKSHTSEHNSAELLRFCSLRARRKSSAVVHTISSRVASISSSKSHVSVSHMPTTQEDLTSVRDSGSPNARAAQARSWTPMSPRTARSRQGSMHTTFSFPMDDDLPWPFSAVALPRHVVSGVVCSMSLSSRVLPFFVVITQNSRFLSLYRAFIGSQASSHATLSGSTRRPFRRSLSTQSADTATRSPKAPSTPQHKERRGERRHDSFRLLSTFSLIGARFYTYSVPITKVPGSEKSKLDTLFNYVRPTWQFSTSPRSRRATRNLRASTSSGQETKSVRSSHAGTDLSAQHENGNNSSESDSEPMLEVVHLVMSSQPGAMLRFVFPNVQERSTWTQLLSRQLKLEHVDVEDYAELLRHEDSLAAMSTVSQSAPTTPQPHSHRAHPKRMTTLAMRTGVLSMYASVAQSSLTEVLETPQYLFDFIRFCHKHLTGESIHCLTCLTAYRETYSRPARRERALLIYELFLSRDAIEPVNISDRTRTSLELRIDQEDFALNLFEGCETELHRLLSDDVFPRYRAAGRVDFVLDAANHEQLRSESFSSPSFSAVPRIDDLSMLRAIIHALTKSGRLHRMKRRLRAYQHAVKGSKLVEWLLEHKYVRNKPSAIALGQRFLDARLLASCRSDCDFFANSTLYALVQPTVSPEDSETSGNSSHEDEAPEPPGSSMGSPAMPAEVRPGSFDSPVMPPSLTLAEAGARAPMSPLLMGPTVSTPDGNMPGFGGGSDDEDEARASDNATYAEIQVHHMSSHLNDDMLDQLSPHAAGRALAKLSFAGAPALKRLQAVPLVSKRKLYRLAGDKVLECSVLLHGVMYNVFHAVLLPEHQLIFLFRSDLDESPVDVISLHDTDLECYYSSSAGIAYVRVLPRTEQPHKRPLMLRPEGTQAGLDFLSALHQQQLRNVQDIDDEEPEQVPSTPRLSRQNSLFYCFAPQHTDNLAIAVKGIRARIETADSADSAVSEISTRTV